MAFLEVKNLSHTFGVGTPDKKAAVRDISFSLNEGEILGIIGHTGSGKSTLVSHLNGLMKPTEGSVLINGKDIWENPKEITKIRSTVGLVFQYPEYQLFEDTVYKDISFGPQNLGLTGEELDKTVKSAAEIMKIDEELFEKSPFDLSGGQKRRVAIAGVLAMNPKVIVFDEPTAGLDPIGKATIFKAILQYREKFNAVVIIVSHSMEEIAAISDKVLVLNEGKAVSFGNTRDVFSDADKLKNLGLNVPMITNIFIQLSEKYKGIIKNVLTVNEAISVLTPLIDERRNENA